MFAGQSFTVSRLLPDGGLDASYGDDATPGTTNVPGGIGFNSLATRDGSVVLAGKLPTSTQNRVVKLTNDLLLEDGFE